MADATRLKIIASVEGVQGFDNLKRSLQGLAQEGQQSGRSLDKLYTAYQQLSGAGRNSISAMRQQINVLGQLRDSADVGSRRFRILTQDLERMERQLQQTSRAGQAARPALGGGLGALGGLATQIAPQLAVGAAVAGVATAGISAESAQVRLKALTDQYGEFNQATEATARIASTLRMNTAEAAQSFASLYASLRPTGITVKELEDTLIGFAAAARNSGASAQETSAALIQLKQGLASGVLQGEELRSIREQAPLAAQAIAREMGVSIGALKNLAAEGKVTTDVVLRAMQRLKGEQLGKLNAQFNTAEQAMTDAKNAAFELGVELSKIGGPLVVGAVRELIDAIKGATGAVERLGAGLENFKKLQPILSPITKELQNINEKSKSSGLSNWIDSVSKRIATGMIPGLSQVLSIIDLINRKTGGIDLSTGAEKLTKAGVKQKTYSVPGVGTFDMITGRMVTSLTDENRADQAKAKAEDERRKSGQAAGAGKKPTEAEVNARALLNTIRFAEGTLGPAGYGTHFGGGYSPPGAAHPDQVVRAGGYASAAYGAYQWMPGTWAAYGGGSMSPERQDAAALRLIRSKGVDPTQPLTREMIDALAPTWASFPTMKTGTSYYRQGGKTFSQLQSFYRQQVEKGGGDVGSLDLALGKESVKTAADRQKGAEDLAKQAQKTLATNRQLTEQRTASLQSTINENAQATVGLQIAEATDEAARLRLQKKQELLDLEIRTNEQLKSYLDEEERPQIMDTYRKNKKIIELKYAEQIADAEAKRNSAMLDFSASNAMMQPTISAELQKQADAMERQRNMAEGIASTIGQGFSQAFNLAIQGSEDWKRSLSEIAGGVLRDIAQQLIQIAVINQITKGITGMLSPAAGPTQNAPSYRSAGFLGTGSLPSGSNMPMLSGFSPDFGAGFTPDFGVAPFATGGIMTPQGPVPLRSYARGGVAMAPQAAIFGEGSTPEAFVPLPDGRRIPVALRQYPGIPGGPGAAPGFEQTDAVVQRLVESARQESAVRAATTAAAGPDGTMRIQIETTRINSVDYVTAAQAEALAQAAATRSTARQQRALQASPAARRSVGI